MRRKWLFKNARNFEENSRFGNHVFFAQKDEILLSMLTEVEFKVIRGLRTDTGDYTIGEEKSLLVPRYCSQKLIDAHLFDRFSLKNKYSI